MYIAICPYCEKFLNAGELESHINSEKNYCLTLPEIIDRLKYIGGITVIDEETGMTITEQKLLELYEDGGL